MYSFLALQREYLITQLINIAKSLILEARVGVLKLKNRVFISIFFFAAVILNKYQEQPQLLDPYLGKSSLLSFKGVYTVTCAFYICKNVIVYSCAIYHILLPLNFYYI